MPFADATFVNGIKAMRNVLKTYDGTSGKTQADAIEYEATQLQSLIKAYVQSATITVAAAIPVQTVPATGTGATTATGTASMA